MSCRAALAAAILSAGSGPACDEGAGNPGDPLPCEEWGARAYFDACGDDPAFGYPGPELRLDSGDHRLDTTAMTLDGEPIGTDAILHGVEAHLIVTTALIVEEGASLQASGDRPLALAVAGPVRIGGTVSVDGGEAPGAGSIVGSRCGQAGASDPVGAGGGGGGGFNGEGGAGGGSRSATDESSPDVH